METPAKEWKEDELLEWTGEDNVMWPAMKQQDMPKVLNSIHNANEFMLPTDIDEVIVEEESNGDDSMPEMDDSSSVSDSSEDESDSDMDIEPNPESSLKGKPGRVEGRRNRSWAPSTRVRPKTLHSKMRSLTLKERRRRKWHFTCNRPRWWNESKTTGIVDELQAQPDRKDEMVHTKTSGKRKRSEIASAMAT